MSDASADRTSLTPMNTGDLRRSISAPATVVLLATAVALLGWVLSRPANPESIWLLTLALFLIALSLLVPAQRVVRGGQLVIWVALAVGISQILQMLVRPLQYRGGTLDQAIRQIVLLGGISALLAVLARWRCGLVVLVALTGLAGWWMIRIVPTPGIDVFPMVQEASRATLEGRNPYSIRLRDPYSPEDSARFFGPGMSRDGFLQFGYNYPPLSLIAGLPGYALAGDIRYSHLVLMVAAAALLTLAARGRMHLSAPALLVLTPSYLLVLCMAWTEPVTVFFVALLCFAQARARWMVPWAAGLLLASKQYMVLAAPLMLLLIEHPWTLRKIAVFAGKAVVTAALVTLPLALWDFHEFMHSAVLFHFSQPFRGELLSYLTRTGLVHPERWTWLAPLFWLAITVAVLLSATKRPTGFFAPLALVMLLFFSCSRMGAMNYYYIAYAVLCCAIAEEARRHQEAVQTAPALQ